MFYNINMDKRSQEQFDQLVELQPQELNTESIKFLFGRRAYMTSDQLEKFSDVFEVIEEENKSKDGKVEEEVVTPEKPQNEQPKKENKKKK